MGKAYILISVEPARTKDVLKKLRSLPDIMEVNEVMGPYDVVVEVGIRELADVTAVLREKIRPLDGVQSTLTCVAMP